MSKKQKAKVAANEAPATEAKAPAPELIKNVKRDAKFRGARDAWYQLLVEHDGKPVADFYSAAKAKPPALTKAGTAEDPRGWLRYFKRVGVCELGT